MSTKSQIKLKSIVKSAYVKCMYLESIIPSNVTTIDSYAFFQCTGLNTTYNIISYCWEMMETLTISEGFISSKALCIHNILLYIHESSSYDCFWLNGNLNIPLRCQLAKDVVMIFKNMNMSNNVFRGCSELNEQLIIPDEVPRNILWLLKCSWLRLWYWFSK